MKTAKKQEVDAIIQITSLISQKEIELQLFNMAFQLNWKNLCETYGVSIQSTLNTQTFEFTEPEEINENKDEEKLKPETSEQDPIIGQVLEPVSGQVIEPTIN